MISNSLATRRRTAARDFSNGSIDATIGKGFNEEIAHDLGSIEAGYSPTTAVPGWPAIPRSQSQQPIVEFSLSRQLATYAYANSKRELSPFGPAFRVSLRRFWPRWKHAPLVVEPGTVAPVSRHSSIRSRSQPFRQPRWLTLQPCGSFPTDSESHGWRALEHAIQRRDGSSVTTDFRSRETTPDYKRQIRSTRAGAFPISDEQLETIEERSDQRSQPVTSVEYISTCYPTVGVCPCKTVAKTWASTFPPLRIAPITLPRTASCSFRTAARDAAPAPSATL